MTIHSDPIDSTSRKRWNVMVYLAADNNLSEESVFSLKEMKRIGAAEGVRVTARYYTGAIKTGPLKYDLRKQSYEELIAQLHPGGRTGVQSTESREADQGDPETDPGMEEANASERHHGGGRGGRQCVQVFLGDPDG